MPQYNRENNNNECQTESWKYMQIYNVIQCNFL